MSTQKLHPSFQLHNDEETRNQKSLHKTYNVLGGLHIYEWTVKLSNFIERPRKTTPPSSQREMRLGSPLHSYRHTFIWNSCCFKWKQRWKHFCPTTYVTCAGYTLGLVENFNSIVMIYNSIRWKWLIFLLASLGMLWNTQCATHRQCCITTHVYTEIPSYKVDRILYSYLLDIQFTAFASKHI